MAWEPVSKPERTPEPAAAGRFAPQSPAPAPARSAAATSFLDASTRFEGVIRSSEPLRLDGRVKGEIHCDHSVAIGESALIEAAIRAETVVIAGEVHGEVRAARKITLSATARIAGDLTTPSIVIEEGAQLEGRIQIGTLPPSRELQPERKAESTDRPRDARPAAPSVTPPPPTA